MLWDYLKELNKAGKTILLTTHYIEEAEKLCDEIAIINNGKIINKLIEIEITGYCFPSFSWSFFA